MQQIHSRKILASTLLAAFLLFALPGQGHAMIYACDNTGNGGTGHCRFNACGQVSANNHTACLTCTSSNCGTATASAGDCPACNAMVISHNPFKTDGLTVATPQVQTQAQAPASKIVAPVSTPAGVSR